MGDLFRWPYETRESLPEHGVFVVKDEVPYGPTTEQAIRGGVLAQVVRHPVPSIILGYGILVDPSDDGTQVTLSVDPSILVGGGSGSVTPYEIYRRVVTASLNLLVLKNAPGTFYGWNIGSNAGEQFYVKLYDMDTNPDPANDTPRQVIAVQSSIPTHEIIAAGIPYEIGIAMAITQHIEDDDNTPVSTKDGVVELYFL